MTHHHSRQTITSLPPTPLPPSHNHFLLSVPYSLAPVSLSLAPIPLPLSLSHAPIPLPLSLSLAPIPLPLSLSLAPIPCPCLSLSRPYFLSLIPSSLLSLLSSIFYLAPVPLGRMDELV